ncbi:hypothetical protein [Azoarcus sp. KH32C]|uniref:hypothetical protein n=1 Tax=Azoarcus sp. KH32C TaxID=748247 RepID=UPI0002385C80|nr:hypothetical protein [Azoarcus sp. KH32C]BAL27439.1 hypothetical protein AZKH_p0556 [Azoarcus sp. KH32C]
MRALLAAVLLASLSCQSQAVSFTVTEQNSSLKFTIDDPTFNLNVPNDPVQLPRTVEWTVDGRRILVYPSGPFTMLDIGHIHPGAHVGANQIHAQGPLLGYGSGATTGTVTGAVVYSVNGGATGSGASRISEKVDIHNKSGGAISVQLAGMGFKPTQTSLEVPDLNGLTVEGSTVIYFQGTPQASSLTESPPYPPLTVRPVVNFTGFNPLLNQNFSLPDGAVLTMITELKLSPPLFTVTIVWALIALLAVLGMAAGAFIWRRRSR